MNEALHGGNKYGQIPLAGGDFSLANKGVLGICFYFVNLRLVNFLNQVLIFTQSVFENGALIMP